MKPNEQVILCEREVEKVLRKKSLVDRLAKEDIPKAQFARENNIPRSTLYQLLSRSRLGLNGYVDRRTTKPKKGPNISNDCVMYLVAHKAVYPKAPLKLCLSELAKVATRLNWKVPSYGQVIRLFQNIPNDMRTMLFENSRQHFQEWGLVPRHYQNHANQEWQIDFTEMKLWALDTATGEIFRPYLTNIIDGFSRISMAACVHRTAPTAADTLLALRKAILPKDNEAEPFYGIPEVLSTDNGSVYVKSADFMDALLRLNITHRDIPNNSPASNGKVERMFLTFEEQLYRKLHGYSSQFRGLEKAKNTAIPFPVLQNLIDKYRMDYHTQLHRGINATPWEKWHENILTATNLIFDSKGVISACKTRKEVTVERDGVHLGGSVPFISPKLAGLVGKKVTLRLLPEGYDPAPECYCNGQFIDNLKPQGTLLLSEEISKARLERTEEIRQLRKQMKETANSLVGKNGAVNPRSAQVPPVSSTTPPDEPIGPIEKLKPTDEEE
ncbi:DDE-type integrase/transposase/recombinase [Kamptonema cortianum]|nr:DDE-type integrase/transposase/recombinase [Oscillatoria laete-virens]MDK3155739.1 DDE-type integrase/transposase/recombinase [Kamptonema cortianum]MDL5048038.1 DDE-type integrase/transposase/recombinase [Oscillatoria amoena NRMC-F 0135]MDL5052520.1 DDE-type integrase/transposase/recombinase [Oscillatoria laete-virens NRMC-F 0139]